MKTTKNVLISALVGLSLTANAQNDYTFDKVFGKNGDASGLFRQPQDVTLTSSQMMVVSDLNNHRIQLFDNNGQWLSEIGGFGSGANGSGTGNGEFKSPRGVATFNNFVFVADNANNRIQILQINNDNTLSYYGQFATTYLKNNVETAYAPLSVAVDRIGNLYVATQTTDKVYRYLNNSELRTSTVSPLLFSRDNTFTLGTTLNNPKGIFIDGKTLYIADAGNNRIVEAVVNGEIISLTGIEAPTDMTLNAITGNLLVSFASNNSAGVKVFSKNKVARTEQADNSYVEVSSFGTYGTKVGTLQQPNGIVVDANNKVIIADGLGQRVSIFKACATQTKNLDLTSCGDYVFNGKTLTVSGVYTETFKGRCDYDSVVTLNLTVKPVLTPSVTLTNGSILSVVKGTDLNLNTIVTNVGTNPTYTWYRQNTNGVDVKINGQTASSYLVNNIQANAVYSVDVTINDKSICVSTSKTSKASVIVNIMPTTTYNNKTNINGTINTNVEIKSGFNQLSGNTTVAGIVAVRSGAILDLNNFTLNAQGFEIEDGAIVIETGNSGISKLFSASPISFTRTQTHAGYTYISSPFTSASGASGYEYNENARVGNNYMSGWKTVSGNFVQGKGYAINGLGTKNITGNSLNNGNVSITATYTDTDVNKDRNGWNLLGNPFAAPLNIATFLSQNGYAAVYFWNGRSYITTNTGSIPAGQAFFVNIPKEANITSKVTNFTSAQVNHNLSNTLQRVAPTEGLSLNLNESDATELLFGADVTDAFDVTADAAKNLTPAVSEIFTLVADKKLAINFLSNAVSDKVVALGITVASAGSNTISLATNNSTFSQVLLKDKVTGTVTDLATSSYTFTSNAGTIVDRFEIQLPSARLTGLADDNQAAFVTVYDNGNHAISINGEFDVITVLDLNGKVIYTGAASTISVNNAGLYLVETISGATKQAHKVIVK